MTDQLSLNLLATHIHTKCASHITGLAVNGMCLCLITVGESFLNPRVQFILAKKYESKN